MTWATNHLGNLSGGPCPSLPSLASGEPLHQEGVAAPIYRPSPSSCSSPEARRARLRGRVRLLAAVLAAIAITELEPQP